MNPDLEKLRRFALTAAVVLFGYVVAGVTIPKNVPFSYGGLTYYVANPQWLPLGLVLASLYGGVRYFYYAVIKLRPPWVERAELIPPSGIVKTFESSMDTYHWVRECESKFPRVRGKTVKLEYLVTRKPIEEKVEFVLSRKKLPPLVRLACWVENVDYILPVLAVGTSLAAFAWFLFNYSSGIAVAK